MTVLDRTDEVRIVVGQVLPSEPSVRLPYPALVICCRMVDFGGAFAAEIESWVAEKRV